MAPIQIDNVTGIVATHAIAPTRSTALAAASADLAWRTVKFDDMPARNNDAARSTIANT
jgi:hypothetical protein